MSNVEAGTYTEWRVTAEPNYDFTWSPFLNPHLGDAERAARGFATLVVAHDSLQNVKLMCRTVTVEPWELTEVAEHHG
jgi:hypothetical protein